MPCCSCLLRWWLKPQFDPADSSLASSYWPAPQDGWKVGDIVSVPTSVLDPVGPRQLGRIEFVSGYNQFADVILPLDPSRPDQRLRARVPVGQLVGPLIATDLGSVQWHVEKRARSPGPPMSPLELEPTAIPEVIQGRTRVLSDPSTCLSGGSPPAKIRRIEPELEVLRTDEPEPEAEILKSDEQPGEQEPEMNVDQFLREDSPVF